VVILAGLSLSATAIVEADTVFLTTGGSIKDCKVVRKDGTLIHLRTPSGPMGVPVSVVDRIEPGGSVFDEYESKLVALKPDDVGGIYGLAKWCQSTAGLREEMYLLLRRVIAVEAHHPQARALLGYVRKGAGWQRLPPVEIHLRGLDDTSMRKLVEGQLTTTLSPRGDIIRLARRATEKPTPRDDLSKCDLVVSVATQVARAQTFYGKQIRGQMVRATVTLVVNNEWTGKPLQVIMSGEVPFGVPDAHNHAVIDAINKGAQDLNRLLDQLTDGRQRFLPGALRAARRTDDGDPGAPAEQARATRR
jgi:hypothetical protein